MNLIAFRFLHGSTVNSRLSLQSFHLQHIEVALLTPSWFTGVSCCSWKWSNPVRFPYWYPIAMQTSTESVVPSPPEGWEQPPSYKVKRCKFCRAYSHSKCPVPPDCFPAWKPLIPWAAGSRDKPKGCVCKICVTIFTTQGWMSECNPPDLVGLEKLIQQDPTRLHPFIVTRLCIWDVHWGLNLSFEFQKSKHFIILYLYHIKHL